MVKKKVVPKLVLNAISTVRQLIEGFDKFYASGETVIQIDPETEEERVLGEEEKSEKMNDQKNRIYLEYYEKHKDLWKEYYFIENIEEFKQLINQEYESINQFRQMVVLTRNGKRDFQLEQSLRRKFETEEPPLPDKLIFKLPPNYEAKKNV